MIGDPYDRYINNSADYERFSDGPLPPIEKWPDPHNEWVDREMRKEMEMHIPSKIVKKSDYPDSWPFAFEEGEIRAYGNKAIVIFSYKTGLTYALNGTAEAFGFTRIDPVWRNNHAPGFEGTKMPLDPFINIGIKLIMGGK